LTMQGKWCKYDVLGFLLSILVEDKPDYTLSIDAWEIT